MKPSRHNIVSQLRGTKSWFVVNLLSGRADVLSEAEARALDPRGLAGGDPSAESGAQSAGTGDSLSEPERWQAMLRGYLVEEEDEREREQAAYEQFVAGRDDDEVQLFYVPTYACNFRCDYCYQAEYGDSGERSAAEVEEAFFAYVDRAFAGRRCYVTLFGGEPLLADAASRATVQRFVTETARRGIDLAVVTNGYLLAEYLPVLREGRIREIQVTLDGPAEVHDRRRPLRSGAGTFQTVADAVDACLEAGLPVNLRMVVDRDNLGSLPALAREAQARGWLSHPKLKTQIGRNYELHAEQPCRGRLLERLELHEALYRLAHEEPELLDLHRPAFSVARHLADNGELPSAMFDACPGCKTEWAFDRSGHIYACTATVGKPGEELGTFYPTVRLDEEAVRRWQARDVRAIEACRDCELQLACGGGCAAVAHNRHGSLHAADCRPIRELLELGLALYAEDDDTQLGDNRPDASDQAEPGEG